MISSNFDIFREAETLIRHPGHAKASPVHVEKVLGWLEEVICGSSMPDARKAQALKSDLMAIL